MEKTWTCHHCRIDPGLLRHAHVVITNDAYTALRAENERLRSFQDVGMFSQLQAAEAENEKLKAELVEADRKVREHRPKVDAALAENERLRAALSECEKNLAIWESPDERW